MRAVKYILLSLIAVGIFYISTTILTTERSPSPTQTIKLHPDKTLLANIEKNYGMEAKQRFVDWQNLIDSAKTASEADKLRLVNDFFNQNIRFVSDMMLWLKEDYWATPMELLTKGAGDCEDFSIAKYFTLLELGVDDSKLRITYVKAIELNQAHIVLTYFESPHAVPLVLDNLNPNISLATDRNDLEPVYSFNGSGLWLAKIKSSGIQVGSSERLNPWADLKQRMSKSISLLGNQ